MEERHYVITKRRCDAIFSPPMGHNILMNFELTEQERDLLLELIEAAEQAAILGMDHADTRAYKDLLRERMHLLDALKAKIRHAKAA